LRAEVNVSVPFSAGRGTPPFL